MTTASPLDVRAALAAPDLLRRLSALGLDPEDASAAADAARSTLERAEDLAVVAEASRRLVARTSVLPDGGREDPWRSLAVGDDGVLPLLALVVSAPAVAAFHAAHDVPPEVSAATLADLGQQVRVHRLVTGGFGLGTYGWVGSEVWSGYLYRLGRLQLALTRVATVDGTGSEWVLSTHVPREGRLDPADVDASLEAAPAFFAERFRDVPAVGLHCRSWLLDPRLAALLPGSNLAAFQRRWQTYGEPLPGDEDVSFFAFGRRGPVEPGELAGTTSLQRAVLTLWRGGEQWHVVDGRLRS